MGFTPGVVAMTCAALVRPPLAPFFVLAVVLAGWGVRREPRRLVAAAVAAAAVLAVVMIPTVLASGGLGALVDVSTLHAAQHLSTLGTESWAPASLGLVRGLGTPAVALLFLALALVGWWGWRRALAEPLVGGHHRGRPAGVPSGLRGQPQLPAVLGAGVAAPDDAGGGRRRPARPIASGGRRGLGRGAGRSGVVDVASDAAHPRQPAPRRGGAADRRRRGQGRTGLPGPALLLPEPRDPYGQAALRLSSHDRGCSGAAAERRGPRSGSWRRGWARTSRARSRAWSSSSAINPGFGAFPRSVSCRRAWFATRCWFAGRVPGGVRRHSSVRVVRRPNGAPGASGERTRHPCPDGRGAPEPGRGASRGPGRWRADVELQALARPARPDDSDPPSCEHRHLALGRSRRREGSLVPRRRSAALVSYLRRVAAGPASCARGAHVLPGAGLAAPRVRRGRGHVPSGGDGQPAGSGGVDWGACHLSLSRRGGPGRDRDVHPAFRARGR